jgi:hypothetical protein
MVVLYTPGVLQENKTTQVRCITNETELRNVLTDEPNNLNRAESLERQVDIIRQYILFKKIVLC